MKPVARVDSGRNDLFRSRLDQIVDMKHPLAKLARQVDWGFLEKVFGAVYKDGPGHPPLPTRLMAGLAILKHTDNLSDERLCEAWVENPYYQLFCGEEFFRHELPFDRSSITRWRKRMGEDKLAALIQESLNIATRTGAAKPADFTRIIVDTTVQEKAVMFPTDAKLMHRAREKLVRLAKRQGVTLRQSYARVGKIARISVTPTPNSSSGRTGRCARSAPGWDACAATSCAASGAMRARRRPSHGSCRWRMPCGQRERGKKIYSLHAPEVECIGKGKAHKPYEFGVKVSLATTLKHSAGGQFIAHAKALPGNPYDGHTLEAVIPDIERQIGATIGRIVADKGYRGHNAAPQYKFRVYISGQKRAVPDATKRDLKRRSAVEPVIGHAKADHRMARNYLNGSDGDANNAVLAAAGYNFRRLLAWLRAFLRLLLARLRPLCQPPEPTTA